MSTGLEIFPRDIESEGYKICDAEGKFAIYRHKVGDFNWFVRIYDNALSLDQIKAMIIMDHMEMYLSQDDDTIQREDFQSVLDSLYKLQLRELK